MLVQAAAPRPKPRARRKPKGQGHLWRAPLIAAARTLVRTAGPAATTIRAVTDHCGLSSSAIYLHFADKDALLEAVYDEFAAMLLAHVDALASVSGPLEETLIAALGPLVSRERNVFLGAFMPSDTSDPRPTQIERHRAVVRRLATVQAMRSGGEAAAARSWTRAFGELVLHPLIEDLGSRP